MRTPARLLARATSAFLLLLAAPAWVGSAEAVEPKESQLAGPRYPTMRLLARYLDETTQGLLEGANDATLHGTPEEARFLSSIRTFARSARDFRSAVDVYQETPFDVSARLAALTEVARALEERLRSASVLERTFPEWSAVREVLDRMRQLLAGIDVEVPPAYVVPVLSGARLEQFRELAAALEESASRAHERARRELGSYQDRGAQFLGELQYFAAVSRDLHTRADTGDVSPKGIGSIVEGTLKEAREADRRMRDAKVFKEVWDDSSRTITILERMASLVRS
jgi:hypothetical protein